MFNQPIYPKYILVAMRHDRALAGTADGIERVVANRVVVAGIDPLCGVKWWSVTSSGEHSPHER